jgi:hypothetical protein
MALCFLLSKINCVDDKMDKKTGSILHYYCPRVITIVKIKHNYLEILLFNTKKKI